jgi:hypothetical protein
MNWGEKRGNIGIEETKDDMAFGSQSNYLDCVNKKSH